MRLERLKGDLPFLLVWSCILLLPFGRSVELPVAFMAVWAIRLIMQQGHSMWWEGAARLFTLMFLALWLPALVSVIDAENLQKSIKTVLTLPRFYLAGLFVIHVLSNAESWGRFLCWSAWLLLFWLVDAVVQLMLGYDLFGYVALPQRLNGVFGEEHIKLGLVLPVFLGLLFEHARRNWSGYAQFGVVLLALMIVFMAGSRAGWIMLTVVLITYTGHVTARSGRSPALVLSGLMAVGGLLAFATYHASDDFRQRVNQSLLIFSGDKAQMDVALSTRLPIWGVAVRMIEDNPVNGVGARGFRYAYPQYAEPDDPFVAADHDAGAMHSHQMILEVLSETGFVGLLGLLFLYGLVVRAWVTATDECRRWMLPGGLGALAVFFPVNTHFAIYSSFWSQIVWFVLAVYCAGRLAAHRM